MKKYTIYQIDAFTTSMFKGNPAGIVVNADGLSDKQMQQIAKELNNSETAFLFPPDDENCDGVIRYFTPTIEVPICGHATIAAMYAKAIEEKLESVVFYFKTKVGILPFEIIKSDGVYNEGTYKILMTQGDIEISPPLSDEIQSRIVEALGFDIDHLDKKCPIQIASAGHSKVMIGVNTRAVLNNLEPDFLALVAISKEITCNGYFVFTFDSDEKDVLTHGRMFAPAIGIQEDPVTGNANGPLGAYLVHNKLVDYQSKQFRFKGKQGEKMGREGYIEVIVDVKNQKPQLVKIVGEAVVVFKTELEV